MEDSTNYTLLKQHNLVTQAKYNMSSMELDVFFALIATMGKDGVEKGRYYTIHVEDMEEAAGKVFHVTRLQEVTKSLISRVYTLQLDNGGYLQLNLLASARYDGDARSLVLRVNPEMEGYLLNLKENFTLYYLEYALRLNSKYAKRLYQMLCQFRSTGVFKIPILKLKELLELYDPKTGDEQYRKVSAFKRYVLDIAQEELAGTDMPFTYTLTKKGRSYKSIEFYFSSRSLKRERKVLKKKKQQPKASPLLHPEEQPAENSRTLYERMTADFKLNHEQMREVFEGFDLKTINKALYDIKLNINDGKVSNKAAYTMRWFENL